MVRTVIFDARSLQDPRFWGRGIGRLGANLVRTARSCITSDDLRVVGLIDPTLPPLAQEVSIFFDELRTGDLWLTGPEPKWFIELSPMTHDPLFTARICARRDVFKAAIVYDFIPFEEPERYLPTLADKIDYHARLSWLARYDHFFPISNYSMSNLIRMLGTPQSRISLNAPPIANAFLDAATDSIAPEGHPVAADHILVVAGADRRKNVDCAIGAHANSWTGRTRRTRLLIAGGYPEHSQASLRGLYEKEGGAQSQLIFLEHLPDQALVELYRTAICIVVPSRSEGFSIPVVEAMAVGAPVLASRIPAHCELIGNSDFMFDTEEHLRLASLMDRIAINPDLRNEVIESQKNRWQRFRADEVARAFWTSMEAHAQPSIAAPLVGGHRPQVAFLGPLPPDRSGVADYTAASFKALSRHVDIHAFSGERRASPLEGAVSLQPLSALPFISNRFDRVIGVMGNSHFHARVFDLLMQFGGACISHDNRLFGFYLTFFGVARARELAQRELGRPLEAGELEKWAGDESTLEATFLGELAARCEPLIVHSRVTARIVEERFGARPTLLPFSIYRDWTDDALAPARRAEARRQLGIAPRTVMVVAMGFVNSSKAPLDCIWALEMLRGWGIPAELYFVGEMQPDPAPLHRLCDDLEVADHVHFVSAYVAEADFRNYLLAADVAVQLRTHLLGGLSGALLDCIAAGLPTVTNRDLAEAMEAPSYVFPVTDRPSPVLIAEALTAAIESRVSPQARVDERRAYLDAHNFDVYARGLCEALGLDVARSAAA
jgi:glycosyltransferase involved in cell wall biosynthesis